LLTTKFVHESERLLPLPVCSETTDVVCDRLSITAVSEKVWDSTVVSPPSSFAHRSEHSTRGRVHDGQGTCLG